MAYAGGRFRPTMAVVIRMMRLSFDTAPGLMIWIVANKTIAAFIPIAQVLLMKEIVDEAVALFGGTQNIGRMLFLLGIQAAVLLAYQYLQYNDRLSERKLHIRLKFHLDERISARSAAMPLSYFESSAYYDQSKRAASAQNHLYLIGAVFSIMQNGITLVSYSLLLLQYSVWLLVSLLVLVIPLIAVHMKVGQKRFSLAFVQTPLLRRLDYWFHLLVGREAAKEVRTYQLSNYLQNRWREVYRRHADEMIGMEKKAASSVFSVDAAVIGIQVLVSGLLVWLGAKGRLTVGDFVALIQAFASAQSAVQLISVHVATVYENSLFVKQYFDFIDSESSPAEAKSYGKAPFPKPLMRGIQVHELEYTYPGQSGPALHGVSFTIRPGSKVAIVGENGSGKSTLAKCLLGLYSEYKGDIWYDDLELREIDAAGFRNEVTAMFQDFVRYQSSLRDNIGFGDIQQIENDYKIYEAANKAGLHDFVRAEAVSLEDELGPLFHGGRDISGGQWQRIALARANMRHAQVVILDEPTAAVDPVTEAEIFDGLRSISRDRTTIMITHRLAICESFDEIIVMKEGKMAERGTHDTLMRQDGEYAAMFRAQKSAGLKPRESLLK